MVSRHNMVRESSLLFPWFRLAMLLYGVCVLSGCGSLETVPLTHVFPSAGVALSGGRRIQVVSFSGAPASVSQLDMVSQVLSRIAGIQVVTSDPDYWLVTGWVSGYGQSQPAELQFSGKLCRGVTNGHDVGGERLLVQPRVTTSCAMIATFSLVRAADLTPVTLFNVGIYDSDFSPGASRSLAMYENEFRKSLTTKLYEVFVQGTRGIVHQTVVPDHSPQDMLGMLGRRGALQNMPSFEEFAARDGQVAGGDRELMLTKYFLSFLNEELFCVDVEGLMALHGRYLRLLSLGNEETFLEATARGLARVEEKLRLLGHTPLTWRGVRG